MAHVSNAGHDAPGAQLLDLDEGQASSGLECAPRPYEVRTRTGVVLSTHDNISDALRSNRLNEVKSSRVYLGAVAMTLHKQRQQGERLADYHMREVATIAVALGPLDAPDGGGLRAVVKRGMRFGAVRRTRPHRLSSAAHDPKGGEWLSKVGAVS